jgi:hypothetical protein
MDVAPINPPQPIEPFAKCRIPRLSVQIVFGERSEHADASHLIALLRARSERPCNGSATDKADKLPAPHVGSRPKLKAFYGLRLP